MNQTVMGSVLAKEKGLTFSKMCKKKLFSTGFTFKVSYKQKKDKNKKKVIVK